MYTLLRKFRIINKKAYKKKEEKYSRYIYEELAKEYAPPVVKKESKIKSTPIDVTSVGILTRGATRFIGNLIEEALRRYNIKSKAQNDFNAVTDKDDKRFFFVLTPMIYQKGLPDNYAAIQMEQTISDRWFTDDYIKRLNNAKCVLDYSLENIRFLKKKNIGSDRLFYFPICPYPHYSLNELERTTDVLFYGDDRCERRQHMLTAIAEHVNLKRAFCVYGDAMDRELDQAKIVVNIHYYEGAMLETTRICEALSRGCFVVSEQSINDAEYPELCELIDFVPINDSEAMVNRLKYWVNHPEEREKKLKQIQAKIDKLFLKFCYYIGRVLYYQGIINFELLYHISKDAFNLGDRICIGCIDTDGDEDMLNAMENAGFTMFPPVRLPDKEGTKIASTSYVARLAWDRGAEQSTICDGNVTVCHEFGEQLTKFEATTGADLGDIHLLGLSDISGKELTGKLLEDGILNPSMARYTRKALHRVAYGSRSDDLRQTTMRSWLSAIEKKLSVTRNERDLVTSLLPLSQKQLTENPKVFEPFEPLVSVVVPCYNQECFIRDCLRSILAQTFLDYEVIVVNDGSTDDSWSIISEFAAKYPDRIRGINIENSGVVVARNTAIEQARGKYVFPLDGDDLIHPECLEKLYMASEEGKGDVVYSQTEFFGTKTGLFKLPLPTRKKMPHGNCVVCSAMYKKSDWIQYGGYDLNCKLGYEDWCFWLSFIADEKKFHRLEDTLFYYRRLARSRNLQAIENEKMLMEYIKKKFHMLYA